MSLTYLQSNQFNYQDIPANAIVYRSGTSGFETIQQSQGVLMSDGSTYSFGIPTAEELISNYKGNSIVMTQFNKLVEVPVEGTSPNKLLRYINNAWKIVDFSVEYIKQELYDPSSWQIWIADNDINVINIPKESINNNIWGVKYITSTNTFNVFTPDAYNLAVSEITIQYMNKTTSFENVYNNAIIYSSDNSSDSSLYTVFYSSQKSEIFNGVVQNYILDPTATTISSSLRKNIMTIFLYGGIYIENYNDYTSNAAIVSIVTDGTTTATNTDSGSFRNISQCIKLQNGGVIIPVEIVCIQSSNGFTFTNPFKIYIMIKTDRQDTAVYHWYYPRNYMNMYIRNAGN